MAPLILHNVSEDELYVGEDGIQRPYAMIWPDGDRQPPTRSRRSAAETGSFGKSTRRSRSRTGTTPARREDPTMHTADKIFASYVANQTQAAPIANAAPQRKPSFRSQSNIPQDDDTSVAQQPHYEPSPTEVTLRGYKNPDQQYAAINHYEQLAGRICEDYSREPPIEQRRYKSELRDPAFTRRRALTPAERAKVNRADSGHHWVKITFESAESAESAIYASPQRILGHMVYAEPYHGMPPKDDAAVLDVGAGLVSPPSPELHGRSQSLRGHTRRSSGRSGSGTLPKSWTTPSIQRISSDVAHDSPPESRTSTQTIDTATMSTSTGTASSATVTGGSFPASGTDALEKVDGANNDFCRRIPTARKVKILPAEQALLPQQTATQRMMNKIPFLKWFSGSMIGNEVPRNDMGEFDYNKASLYWKMIWVLDYYLGLFSGEIVGSDKED